MQDMCYDRVPTYIANRFDPQLFPYAVAYINNGRHRAYGGINAINATVNAEHYRSLKKSALEEDADFFRI